MSDNPNSTLDQHKAYVSRHTSSTYWM